MFMVFSKLHCVVTLVQHQCPSCQANGSYKESPSWVQTVPTRVCGPWPKRGTFHWGIDGTCWEPKPEQKLPYESEYTYTVCHSVSLRHANWSLTAIRIVVKWTIPIPASDASQETPNSKKGHSEPICYQYTTNALTFQSSLFLSSSIPLLALPDELMQWLCYRS